MEERRTKYLGRTRKRGEAAYASAHDEREAIPLRTLRKQEETYVLHEVEPHHTLAGIALQYLVQADQLKRINSIWNDDELHTRKTIRIPASKDGFLYSTVMESGDMSALVDPTEAAAKTHTTRKPLRPTSPSAGFIVEHHADDGRTAEAAEAASESMRLLSSDEILAQYDTTIQAAQSSLESVESVSPSFTALDMSLARTTPNSLTNWLPSDWRSMLAACVLVAVIIPLAFVFIGPYVQAPPPHGSP
eukprot:m.49323 g.49323  ORF g.49323 m.49323 type:complete len:247 (-) comp11087_c0_seq5:3361-4101(-)